MVEPDAGDLRYWSDLPCTTCFKKACTCKTHSRATKGQGMSGDVSKAGRECGYCASAIPQWDGYRHEGRWYCRQRCAYRSEGYARAVADVAAWLRREDGIWKNPVAITSELATALDSGEWNTTTTKEQA